MGLVYALAEVGAFLAGHGRTNGCLLHLAEIRPTERTGPVADFIKIMRDLLRHFSSP